MAEKIELAKAYVQVIPTAQGISGKLTAELQPETDKASESAGKSGGGKFASGFKTAASVIAGTTAAALGTAVAGITTMTKSAIANYSEYEQLVGGVETLFKDSAGVVQQYAAQAFQTAGMNANDYMETVTSFSASLLQGLDGDTATAAEKANKAITQMSDNANKMGTDMASIQNAYQGFAKQNYTMLDNLKLGYGGTASEMARLVNESGVLGDSMKVTAETVKNVPFDKLIDAIGVVQDELGITGTTAKEAASTLQGSAGMMKAAWDNMLTEMAAGNTVHWGQFTEAVKTYLDNLVPVIKQTIPSVAAAIGDVVGALIPMIPEILDPLLNEIVFGAMILTSKLVEILPEVLDVLIGMLPQVVEAIMNVIPMLVGAFTQSIPTLLEAGFMILSTIADGIINSLPAMIPQMVQIVFDIVDRITAPDAISSLIGAAVDIMLALTDGIINAIPELVTRLPEIIISIVNTLTSPENLGKILQSAVTMVLKLAEGLVKAIPDLVKAIPKIIKAIVQGIINAVGQMAEAGLELVKGLWQGLSNAIGWIKDKIKGWVGNVLGFIKGLFGIHSQSTEMAYFGEMLDRGLAEGIEDNVQPIRRAMDEITDATMGSLSSDIMVDGALGTTGSAATGQLGVLIATVEALSTKLDRMQVVLDSGELVGGIKNRMDAALGDNSVAVGRAVAYA